MGWKRSPALPPANPPNFGCDKINVGHVGSLRIRGKGSTHLHVTFSSARLCAACQRIPGITHGGTMQKKLPARPNLEHLRGQAKALLASAKAGDSEALATLAEHHPAPAADAFGLSDAQLAVARKHGYASWPRLVHYVEELSAMEGTWAFTSLETDGSPMPSLAFNRSRLIIDGDRFAMASPEATYE